MDERGFAVIAIELIVNAAGGEVAERIVRANLAGKELSGCPYPRTKAKHRRTRVYRSDLGRL